MKIEVFVGVAWVVGVGAGPVKRACEMRKCVTLADGCGGTYENCWDECALGSQPPTISTPSCTTVATPTAAPPSAQIGLFNLDPVNTDCPEYNRCDDLYVECGGHIIKYGGCYTSCGMPPWPKPTCDIPPSNGTVTTQTLTATPTASKPAASRGPCKHKFEWMCAPKDW